MFGIAKEKDPNDLCCDSMTIEVEFCAIVAYVTELCSLFLRKESKMPRYKEFLGCVESTSTKIMILSCYDTICVVDMSNIHLV